jgi:hypothetical protein
MRQDAKKKFSPPLVELPLWGKVILANAYLSLKHCLTVSAPDGILKLAEFPGRIDVVTE